MEQGKSESAIPDEIVRNKILLIRGKKVMIDRDLADLYGLSTKQMNQQVKRNLKRFPADFMFQLTEKEKEEVVTFCDHLSPLKYSSVLPNAFTEYGAVMLASVLNSERAIEVNIQIVRIFTQMRDMMSAHNSAPYRFQEKRRTGRIPSGVVENLIFQNGISRRKPAADLAENVASSSLRGSAGWCNLE